MHVWLVYPYGSLPGESWRENRTVLAARALVAAGHTVTWWVAAFEHRSKTFRSHDWENRNIFPGFDVIIVPTPGYKRHMSLRRIRFERTFARRVAASPERSRRPDLIVLGEPALFTAGPIIALSKRMNVPMMVDVVDLWPELFEIALPRSLRAFGSALFAPLYRRRAALARHADGYVAVSRDYLALFQELAPRDAAAVVYWGVDVAGVRDEMHSSVALPAAVTARTKGAADFWVVYAGTLGQNYDISTILAAAHLLKKNPKITIFIAGDGASRSEVERGISDGALSNCVFLGSLAAATVARLYSRCDAALSTYVAGSTVSMPIKAYDYFAAGLPIVNSLGRDLGDFVATREVGLQYTPEDPQSLAQALRTLADDPALRNRMANNSARLGTELDWRPRYKSYVAVAERIVAERIVADRMAATHTKVDRTATSRTAERERAAVET